MFTTEKEATEKFCTPMRAAIQGGIFSIVDVQARNATLLSASVPKCSGSACMQWRWRTPAPGQPGNLYENGDRKGYCGLAGAPAVTL